MTDERARSGSAWAQPLEGMRVVDLSLLLPGPCCASLLAQTGAAMTKAEPPGGDPLRHLNPAGFEAVRARDPHIVYAPISGCGQEGPYAAHPGHDVIVIAAAGYCAQTLDLEDATMQRPCLRIADCFAGTLGLPVPEVPA